MTVRLLSFEVETYMTESANLLFSTFTKLPTKDEPSETNRQHSYSLFPYGQHSYSLFPYGQHSYSLFPYIHDYFNCKLVSFFTKSSSQPLKNKITF